MKRKYVNLTIVSFIIGFMLFVQYNTVQNPTTRDAKNIWEIRNELSQQLKVHSELLNDIRELTSTVNEYESDNAKSPEEILQKTLEQMKQESGEQKVSGPGFIMNISPSEEAIQFGYEVNQIPPLLLTRLVNELNRNKAEYIEIDGQRLTFWSAIRDINGKTTVNGRAIKKADVEIKVIGNSMEDVNKLYNYMLASTLMDEFYIDNLTIDVSDVRRDITINSTVDEKKTTYLKAVE